MRKSFIDLQFSKDQPKIQSHNARFDKKGLMTSRLILDPIKPVNIQVPKTSESPKQG